MAQQNQKPTKAAYKLAPPPGMCWADYLNSPEYLLEHISPELQQQIDKIIGLLEKDRRNNILARYDLGLLVKEVYDEETMNYQMNRYGDKSMEKLCLALPWSRSLLYQTLRVVQVISREEAEQLAGLHTQAGCPIYWSHVRILADVACPNTRKGLLERTLQENWTCDELDSAIMQLKKSHESASVVPKKIKGPRNLNGMIEQQRTYADHFLKQAEGVWNDPYKSLTYLCKDVSSKKCTEEGAKKLKDLADRLRLVAEEAEERAQDAQEAYERYAKVLLAAQHAAKLQDGPEKEEDLEDEEPDDRIDAKRAAEFFNDAEEEEEEMEEKEEQEAQFAA
jgi:hypothetical protein